MPAKEVTIYPDAKQYLDGVPAVPTTLPADEAKRLVATGAFHFEAPEGAPPIEPAGRPAPAQEDPE